MELEDTIVLDEEVIDENYKPSDEELIQQARVLDVDPESEPELMWIVRKAFNSACSPPWKYCRPRNAVSNEESYYFNFDTGESTWEHPCDLHYRRVVIDERERLRASRQSGQDGGGSSETTATASGCTVHDDTPPSSFTCSADVPSDDAPPPAYDDLPPSYESLQFTAGQRNRLNRIGRQARIEIHKDEDTP